VSGGDDKCINLWSLAQKKKIAKIGLNEKVTSLAFNDSGDKLAIAVSSNPLYDKM
jgi:WD40 repeat protein